MSKAVIFDLDGTLLDTLTTIAYFGNETMEKFGFNRVPKERYKIHTGLGAANLVRRLMGETRTFTDEEYKAVYEYYMNIYDTNPSYLTEPYDGIVNMLTRLKEYGYKTAVLSNKPDLPTRLVVEKVLPDGLIDICRGASDAFPLKPDAANALNILSQLGADKKGSFFVGDTKTDIETGKNADLTTIGVLWGFRDREELKAAGADFIAAHPNEILLYLGIL